MINSGVVDALTSAVRHVLASVAGISAELQRVQAVTQISIHHELCIGIGFEGGAEGGVYLILDPLVAGRIAAKMDGVEETPDENVVAANLMELVNMIAGNSVGLLAKAGFGVAITTPVIVREPPATPYGAECAMAYLQCGLGTLKVGIIFADLVGI